MSYLACTLCVPLFCTLFLGVETEGLLDFQGKAGLISIVRWNSEEDKRATTNVQNRDSSNSFYYLFFSFIILELKPLVLKGKVRGEIFMKKCQKVRKNAKNYETILPFSFCPLVFL